MRILHVTTHMNIGGIGQYIYSLCSAMKQIGVESVVASSGGDLVGEMEKSGIKHVQIGIKTKFEFSAKVFISASKLSSIIKEEKIDLVHAHTRVSQVAASLASRKSAKHYVSTCHGFFKPRLSRKLFDSWGDKVIAISAPVKAHLEIDFSIPPERIELIHNGVDLKRFSRIYSAEDITNLKRSIGLKDGPVVGTMGRLSSVKGQRFLVEAMRHLIIKKPDAQCLIIGGGPEEDALKSLAKSLGVEGSIKFAGSVYKDIASYLACIDVFVLPSIKEGLGLALLEAMAASRPCVASDIGGISDIVINGRNGLLAPVANGVAIADTVMNLLNDKALSARLAAEGNKYVKENFSVESMAQKMFKLYNGVVREKK